MAMECFGEAEIEVHLCGMPAPMDEIMAVAAKHKLLVLEDCAQAFGSKYHGRTAGTIGDVTCYSLQQSKHMTSGEGGIFATDAPQMYKRALLFANGGMPWYGYGLDAPKPEPLGGVPTRGHFAFGHNYRMSELQGAVCAAQLQKMPEFNRRRRELVDVAEAELGGAKGLEFDLAYPDTEPNYWQYPVLMPPGLGNYGEINYLEDEFQKMQRQRRTSLGIPLPDYVNYDPGICPNAEAGAKRMDGLGVHHAIDPETVRASARRLREQAEQAG